MIDEASLQEQVSTNLIKVESLPHFTGGRLWLTFYLCGEPERLKHVAAALDEQGWQNTDGWEGAFLYPKAEVERTVGAIVEVAERMQTLCRSHAIDILSIDADTSPDVRQSQFVTLFQSNW